MTKMVDRIGHIEGWRYVAAKYQGADRGVGGIRHIVIHDMEAPEKSTTAEAVAGYFQNPTYVSSAHVNIDNDSLVQSVYDGRVAYAAPGANHDGWQVEQAGYARQSRAEWLDPYSRDVIDNAANASAQLAIKAQLPLDLLNVDRLRANHKGITTHKMVSDAFKRSSHYDPGTGYPMDFFMERAVAWDDYWRRGEDEAAPDPVRDPVPPLEYEVGVIWESVPDEGAARVLGMAHSFRPLSRGEAEMVGVGIWVTIGFGDGPDVTTIRGLNRNDTASKVASLVKDTDWAEEIRRAGRDLAARREG